MPVTLHVDTATVGPTLRIEGDLDETTDFGRVTHPGGTLTIDLGSVRRINSCGVREWINFIRSITASGPVKLTKCSIPIVEQLNMVFNFRGGATIESFQAPYCCTKCEAPSVVLLTPADVRNLTPPDSRCRACGGSSVLDDLPQRYLAFLEGGS
jgi:anti-anti-sigma regulatory factor